MPGVGGGGRCFGGGRGGGMFSGSVGAAKHTTPSLKDKPEVLRAASCTGSDTAPVSIEPAMNDGGVPCHTYLKCFQRCVKNYGKEHFHCKLFEESFLECLSSNGSTTGA
ncbi:hypothetical protein L1049_025257 [Liquidambar formosana]|uniref:CHCH domain-containing protein n=1 Tax=Liquidambar formosana TaxID=63359 RepID=A0AAP0R2P9_LIQFO